MITAVLVFMTFVMYAHSESVQEMVTSPKLSSLNKPVKLLCVDNEERDIRLARWTKKPSGEFICSFVELKNNTHCRNETKYNIDKSNSLTIDEVTCSDAGEYECKYLAEDDYRQRTKTVKLDVYDLNATTIEFNTTVVDNNAGANVTVPVGSFLELICWTISRLAVDFIWLKNGKRIDYKSGVDETGVESQQDCLTSRKLISKIPFENIQLNAAGNYTCRTVQRGVDVKSEATVSVHVPGHTTTVHAVTTELSTVKRVNEGGISTTLKVMIGVACTGVVLMLILCILTCGFILKMNRDGMLYRVSVAAKEPKEDATLIELKRSTDERVVAAQEPKEDAKLIESKRSTDERVSESVPSKVTFRDTGDIITERSIHGENSEVDPLLVMFNQLSDDLDEEDVKKIKDVLGHKYINKVDSSKLKSATDIFYHLKEGKHISRNNLKLLKEIFTQLRRPLLVDKVNDFEVTHQ
ncbi:uncharacterized protein [Ptychodera flava]|uniref:uncharacterized protein n=1 Tax=Ptychodera flava TaxID=63121 RepID=UPI00396A4F91